MAVFDFRDFSGGYFTDWSSERMGEADMLTAANCVWDGRLRKRKGRLFYASLSGTILGGIRAKIKGTWRTILALESASVSSVSFVQGTGASFATTTYPSATAYTWTSGLQVEFAALGDTVVAVNGTDDPAVIYETASAVYTDTLDRYDTRTRPDPNWLAGQYASATTYTNDTTDAQSSASADFQAFASASGAGFFVGSDLTFNKVTLLDVQATAAMTSVSLGYFGKSSTGSSATWYAASLLADPTWTIVGNKVFEFAFPIDSSTGEILMMPFVGTDSSLANRFAVRVSAGSDPPAVAISAQGVKVEHSQYVTQLFLQDTPSTVASHKSHLFLGAGNWLRFSPYGGIQGWRYRDFHYFRDRATIKQMVPHMDYLAILTDAGLYGLGGNSWANFVLQFLNSVGAIAKRSGTVVDDILFFVGREGVWSWNGSAMALVSKHIRTDIEGFTLTDTAGVSWQGRYLLSFPTNSVTLAMDPDSYRTDELGDAVVSWYRYNSYRCDGFLSFLGDNDSGSMYALDNTPKYLLQLDSGTSDNATSTVTIDMQALTKFHDFGGYQHDKIYRYVKPVVTDSSVTAAINYLFEMRKRDKNGITAVTVTLTTDVSTSGIHAYNLSVPGRLDGNHLAFFVRHDAQSGAELLGIALDVDVREY